MDFTKEQFSPALENWSVIQSAQLEGHWGDFQKIQNSQHASARLPWSEHHPPPPCSRCLSLIDLSLILCCALELSELYSGAYRQRCRQWRVSARFLLVASLSTLFWAPRALLANLKCKKIIVKRMTFTQANHAACCARTFIFEIFDLFSHSFDLSLSLRYFSCGHCLLFHKGICVVSTSSLRLPDCWLKRHSPSSPLNPAPCRLLGVATAPVKMSHGCQGLDLWTFFAIYFVWVFASFQLNKLCT